MGGVEDTVFNLARAALTETQDLKSCVFECHTHFSQTAPSNKNTVKMNFNPGFLFQF